MPANKFKVLLIYPNLQMVNLLPTNIAVLSACLKDAGMDVRVFDTTLYKTEEKSIDEIRVEHMQLRPFNLKDKGVLYKTTDARDDLGKAVDAFKPDVIGITLTDDTYDLGMELLQSLKYRPKHIIAGGVNPAFAPDEAINNPLIDSLCVGEGEEAFVELCERLRDGKSVNDIRNLWVKSGGKILKNPMRAPIDLEILPYDDFSVFEPERIFRPMQGKIYRMIPVTIDRGCPFNCSFCAAPSQRKLYKERVGKTYYREKSVERVMLELNHYIKEYSADYIYFNSETFFSKSESYIRSFGERYADEIGLPFWCQTRVETINAKKIALLKKMGCDRISIGLEHGNEGFRKKVLKKNFTNSQVIKAFKILNKYKIPVTVNNIIGFPDETRDLVFDTINLNRSIRSDSLNAYFFTPYRGTPLREYCVEKGYLDPSAKTDTLMRSSILNMPQFPADEIKGMVRTFPLYVKMPRKYFPKIKVAEKLDADSEKALAELREEFFMKYF